MKILQLFKTKKIEPNSVLEFQGHPESKRLVELMRKGNWFELEESLSKLTNDELYPILSGLAEFATDWDEIPDIPERGMLALLKCYIQVIDAWISRSDKTADEVSEAQFDAFFEKLSVLEKMIDNYRKNNKTCPLIFVPVFKMAMGQGYEINELYQLFIKYTRSTEEHLAAHISMAYSLTEQWGGSHIELFSFCRTSAKTNPRLLALIPYAHFMRWFYNQGWEEESEEKTYFLKDSVQAELAAAFEVYMTQDIGAYEKRLGVNFFAFCFAKGSSNQNLRNSLKYINRSVLQTPWSYDYYDVVEGVNELRQYCKLPKI